MCIWVDEVPQVKSDIPYADLFNIKHLNLQSVLKLKKKYLPTAN